MRLHTLLTRIIAHPPLHAQLLNTFSFLEYVGFRKIVKSTPASHVSATVLRHAQEEGRHALLLKKLAVQLGGEALATYDDAHLLCGAQASTYFQSVDRGIEALLDTASNQRLVYHYVTWRIEVRALHVYGLYCQALANTEGDAEAMVHRQLRGLIKEETRHLEDVTAAMRDADSLFETHRRGATAVEEDCFALFLGAMEHEVETSCV